MTNKQCKNKIANKIAVLAIAAYILTIIALGLFLVGTIVIISLPILIVATIVLFIAILLHAFLVWLLNKVDLAP